MAGNYVSLNFVNGNPSGGSISVSGSGDGTTITTATLIVNSDSVQVGKNLCYITPNVGFIFSHVVAEGDIGSITLTPGQSQILDSVSDFDPIIVTIYFEPNKYTTNYQLKKPATTDYVTIGDINANMDKIDAQMKANADAIAGKAGTSVATQSANGLMSSSDKTKLDGVDSALAGKVSKSGDNMTGILGILMNLPQMYLTNTTDDFTVPATEINTTHYLAYLDKNGQDTFHISEYTYNGGRGMAFTLRSKTTGEIKEANLGLIVEDSGVVYVTAPSWSPGTNDNSNKVMTIKMANSLPSLVHTTGNETIAGLKTFANDMWLYMSNPKIFTRDINGDFSKAPSETTTPFYIQCYDKNGLGYGNILSMYHDTSDNLIFNFGVDARHWKSGLQVVSSRSGDIFATAPTTPSGATGNEIVTANWANSKFVQKSGDTMSGTLTVYGNPFGIINRSLIKQDEVVSGWTRVYQDEVIDSDGNTLGYSQRFRSLAGDGSHYDKLSLGVYAKGGTKTSAVGVVCPENGDGYADAPSWSPGTNDNSDKILTIKMANSLPSLVHTTGNEVISGQKTFTGELVSKGGFEIISPLPYIDFHHGESTQDYTTRIINGADGLLSIDVRTDDLSKMVYMNFIANDGVIVIPSTPSHVTGNQIATADWALSKFQRKITYGTGDPPSGGQAGDIYIKI